MCKFRDHFNTSTFCLEKHSPKGSCHLDKSSMNHTHCSELALRILMWNASYVQKPLQLTWQERVDDTIRERSKSNPSLVTARSNWSIWTKSFSLYWQLRNTDCDNSAVKRETLQKIDMPFLGLADCHWRQIGNCKIAGTSGWSAPISQSQTTVFVGQWMEWDSLPLTENEISHRKTVNHDRIQ